jgi:hypothetical protein
MGGTAVRSVLGAGSAASDEQRQGLDDSTPVTVGVGHEPSEELDPA